MKHSARLLTAGLGLLLSACTVVGPDYQLPKDAAVNRADLQGDLAGESANVVSAPVPADWWKLYNDPRLDALVSQALASSTDLRVAAANLQRARYQTNEAQEAGGFTNSAKAGAQRLQEAGQAFLLPEKVPVANIGDVRSLVIHPASTTHSQLSPEQQTVAGVNPGLVRLSVGLEHIDDILADLEAGFRAAKEA